MKKKLAKISLENLGEIIKSQRLSRHWSKKYLQTRANICSVALWQIENNKKLPSIESACKIADAFDIDIKTFANWTIKLEIQKYAKQYYQCFNKYKEDGNYNQNIAIALKMTFNKKGETYRTKLVKVSQWLKNKKTEIGKTFQQIENETGISSKNFSCIENGDRSISLKSIFLLSRCLSFKPEDLLHLMIQEKIQQYIKWANGYVDKYIITHRKTKLYVNEKSSILDSYNKNKLNHRMNNILKENLEETVFADYLKQLKIDTGISNAHLSKIMGCTKRTIAQLINSYRLPSLAVILRLCDALNEEPIKVFNIVLQDRVKRYIYQHKRKYEEVKKESTNNLTTWLVHLSGEKPHRCHYALKNTAAMLKNLRKQLKLGQTQLSRKLNCSLSTIVKSEKGITTPTPSLLIGLCKLAEYDPDQLFNIMMEEKLQEAINIYKTEFEKLFKLYEQTNT